MLSDTDVEDHYAPSVRVVNLERNGPNCGFQLTRGKWDPYPWVNSVADGSCADLAGLRSGDCLLEVNGEDVLGKRISEVAEIVKSKSEQVSLLLWNSGVDSQCTPEAICCGPMPTNLQRLSACMSSILAFLECPVCLDTIAPPTYQCENGHLICIRCRTRSERCPICRQRFSRGRSLLADQVYNSLIDTFNLRGESAEARTAKMQKIFKLKSKNKNVPDIKITPSHTSKFLERIAGKSSSVDNLASSKLNSDDFNLKTKSLSNQDIFNSASPSVSRASSFTRLSRSEKNQSRPPNSELRSSSCHGSFVSLQRSDEEELPVFYCPFAPNCTSLIKGKNVIEHFQLAHDGPLIQYFKPTVRIDFSKISEQKHLCYLMQIERNVFFLRIEVDCENGRSTADNVLAWTWLLDHGRAAKEFDMQVKVSNGKTNDVFISVRSNVFSLSRTSHHEIKECRKGVFVSTKSIDTTNFSLQDIYFEIDILKSDHL